MKKNLNTVLATVGLLVLLVLTGCVPEKSKSVCDGRQWNSPGERLDCLFPNPPTGRWHAVYSEEFAQKHDLPPENISTDLTPGVDYMEMEVLPYNEIGIACQANMLVKKPHDIALFNLGNRHLIKFDVDRKLLHLVDIQQHKKKLKAITTFSSASRDYRLGTRGYRASTFAMYAEDVLPSYDYISANANCRDVSMHPDYFPDGYALWANKASVWGKYETPYESYNNPETPKGQDFYNSHLFIKIPHEVISKLFEKVPIGRQ